MPVNPNGNTLLWIVSLLIGTGGVGAIVNILLFIRNKKKVQPEVEQIATQGAKNAVEALQIALRESRLEVIDLRNQLVTREKEYDLERVRLNSEINRLTEQLTVAQEIIDRLQVDLRNLKDTVTQSQQSSQHSA